MILAGTLCHSSVVKDFPFKVTLGAGVVSRAPFLEVNKPVELYRHCEHVLRRRDVALLKPINNANASPPAENGLFARDLMSTWWQCTCSLRNPVLQVGDLQNSHGFSVPAWHSGCTMTKVQI